jgi:phospholipid/cholesterol/gamma-HCH transport system substrate-binding protein
MEKSRLESKVGLFVFIGLALLGVLLIQFSKGTSLFRGTYTLRLHASNVGGLKPRAGVLLAGVQVGNVSDIKLSEGGTNVTMILKIYKEYPIYHDARFVIEQAGFLGDQFVSIIPTSNAPPVLTNGEVVECQPPFNLQEVARSAQGFMARIDETAKKVDASVTDLRRVVLNENTLTNFSATLHNMRMVSEQAMVTVNDVNGLVATNGAQVGLAVSNVLYFSDQLRKLSDAANAVVATNGPEISAAVQNIESSTETLKQLMTNLQSGKGLAGTLLQNEQLSANVQSIANNLTIASSNLNRLGLWGFLWHKESVAPTTNAAPAALLSPRARGE